MGRFGAPLQYESHILYVCSFQVDEETVVAAKTEWCEAEAQILSLLHIGAKAAVERRKLQDEEASKFFSSGSSS